MGGLFSKETPKPKLVVEDGSTWGVNNHSTNLETASEDRVLCFKDKSNLYLCYTICESVFPLEYRQYFITDKRMCIVINNNIISIERTPTDTSDYITVEKFIMNKDVRSRMMLLTGPGAFNFSHALRNSEHVARYIYSGAWISNQMSANSELRNLFKDHMNEDQIKLINVEPKELTPNKEGSLAVIYAEATNHANYTNQSLIIKDEDNEALNIVILGPTGSGKSAIVNQLYNKNVVASKHSTKSVTRKVQYTQGMYNERKVNIVDTIGMCDTVLKPIEVYNVVKDSVKANMIFIDKVIIVCYGRIQNDHKESIGKFMEWMNYNGHKKNFVFVYNKEEGVPTADRSKHLAEMCEDLGADISQDETVQGPDGSRRSVKCAHSLGIKPGTPYGDIESELSEFKMAVLSKTNKRITVPLDNTSKKNTSTSTSICTLL